MARRGIVVTVAAALILTGCGTGTEPLTDTEATKMFHQHTIWEGDDTATLAEFSDLVCDNWDEGADGWDVVGLLTEGGMSGQDAGASIVYATAWKCPEHSEKAELEQPGQ